MTTVALRINGVEHSVAADGRRTLLEVLRDELGLTGAKRGCNQGVCGACTVLLDGRPVRACLSLAAACAGHEITTVEGLTEGNELTPVQQAFVEHGAVQCGFCTPGMVLTATALLKENPKPNVAEVRTALSGNLCRCSGYRKIVDAVVAAGGAR
ncbi:MAG: (2Fe-2S)-binding protein [Rhodospirillales bacterium]|nr:(2Fe-2S)-binding protein [Rhodospirillales bacterium]